MSNEESAGVRWLAIYGSNHRWYVAREDDADDYDVWSEETAIRLAGNLNALQAEVKVTTDSESYYRREWELACERGATDHTRAETAERELAVLRPYKALADWLAERRRTGHWSYSYWDFVERYDALAATAAEPTEVKDASD